VTQSSGVPGFLVLALEPGSGRSAVVLGMTDALSRVGRVGVLRLLPGDGPVAGDLGERAEVRTATALGSGDPGPDARVRVLDAHRALAGGVDAVLVEGPDLTGPAPQGEIDLALGAASDLGLPVLLVVGGRGRPAAALLDAVAQDLTVLRARGCALLGVVANRVDPAALPAVRAGLAAAAGGLPAAALPETPVLAAPTVAEVADALGARVLHPGDGRPVGRLIVGAMALPGFLDRVADGDLVITPADRADIVAGTLAAHLSGTFPQVAGLLLTGGEPVPVLRRLVDGLGGAGVAAIVVDTDTFPTATAASAVRGTPTGERRTAAALALVAEHVDVDALLAAIRLDRPRRTTPLVFEHSLIERARADRRHVVLPEGDDDRVLCAADQVLSRGVADVTLLGDPDAVRRRAAGLGLALDGVRIVDPVRSELRREFAAEYARLRRHKGVGEELAADLMTDVSYFGTMMVHRGLADGMVSGAAHTTAHTIRPAFEFVRTAPGVSVVSGAFLMCLADHVLVYADCAVVPEPDAGQLADIAVASAGTAVMVGIEPRIAMLSYSTGTSGSGAGVEDVRRATELVRERRPDLAVDGPLQYDAAVDPAVAAAKRPGSPVAGRATVLVFPDLNTGNNTYKAVQRSAGAVAIGPVLQGLARPVNDLSRGATVTDIVDTVALTAIQAQAAH
jgi:phosphate acetyltransferase